jgi:hypothetical protein
MNSDRSSARMLAALRVRVARRRRSKAFPTPDAAGDALVKALGTPSRREHSRACSARLARLHPGRQRRSAAMSMPS